MLLIAGSEFVGLFVFTIAVVTARNGSVEIDSSWASVIVAAALVFATVALMFENRKLRLESARPAFGFHFDNWPIDGIPQVWYLSNAGGLARQLQIDISQSGDVRKLGVPSCGKDEVVQLGRDFNGRYEGGGKISLKLSYRDTFNRFLSETLEIDVDDMRKTGRHLPYSLPKMALYMERS
jgi:hypothetical protein